MELLKEGLACTDYMLNRVRLTPPSPPTPDKVSCKSEERSYCLGEPLVAPREEWRPRFGVQGLLGAQLIAALPTARPGGQGNIKTLGDAYEFTVDMRDFSPEDIIVTTSNNHIEVRAEKVSLDPLPPQSSHLPLDSA